jgi:release factor glutamine methyltransferase
MAGPTLGEIRARTVSFLRERGVPTPEVDTDWLLSAALGIARLEVHLQFERPLKNEEIDRIRPLVTRRGKREPLAWILGTRGFHSLEIEVHADVLDPRPDTETLVDVALRRLPPVSDDPVYIADVGCGTGAVGLAIAAVRPDVRCYAIDLSDAAIANTRANVERLGLTDRVGVLKGDLLDAVPAHRRVDWVISNPPYVERATIPGLMPEVSVWEPRLALDGGEDGLDIVRRLVVQARQRATCGVCLEIGAGQASATQALLHAAGFVQVQIQRDFGRIERVVSGLVPGAVAP